MALTLKIKYFNTFVLRQEPIVTTSITSVHTKSSSTVAGTSATVTLTASNAAIAVGQEVHGPGIEKGITVAGISSATLTLSSAQKVEGGITLTFSNPTAYPTGTNTQAASNEWYIEESRIKGGFNEKSVDFGAKAYAVDKKYRRNHRENAMIYSGIFNSRTSVNNTNQFSIADNITKSVDIANGSIQKLYAEDTNLIIFQENKVNGALIDKDAIFTAEGGGLSTTAKVVIGQITPYVGEFGIGKNPESFAAYGFKKYFVDKDRGAVLRLSRDGITEISSYGMRDFFRDNLKNSFKSYGMYDMHAGKYVLSLNLPASQEANKQTFRQSTQGIVAKISKNTVFLKEVNPKIFKGMVLSSTNSKTESVVVTDVLNNKITFNQNVNVSIDEVLNFSFSRPFGFDVISTKSNYKTLAFDDRVNGWVSFYTYAPKFGGSLTNKFYTWDSGNLYEHYSNSNRNTFYGVFDSSTISITSNQNPSLVKHYQSVNYEGTKNWKVIDLKSPADDDNNYKAYPIPGNITGRYINQGVVKYAGFTPLEKKYYGQIKINDTTSVTGVDGLTTTGVKGFFTEVIMEHEPVNNDKTINTKNHAELFSVGFNYEQSLY